MKYLSLFSGIGGFELGIQQAYEELYNLRPNELENSERPTKLHDSKNKLQQWECVGYSEIDKYAIQVYNKHFNHKNYGDITKLDASTLPDFELLVGGFPCQAFSIAGKRGGFNDTRGTLFFDVAKILKEKQPRLCLLENVKGLLSHEQGATFRTIISTLDELGYDVQWQVLNSKNFGVPQNRERVFIVGHLRGTSRPEVFPIGESNAKTLNQIVGGGQGNRVYGIDGVSCTQASQAGGQGAKTGLYAVKEATKKGYAEAKEGDSINYSVPNSKTRRGRVGNGIANTLDTACSQGTLDGVKIRRLTPKECERLQGFPDDWTKTGLKKVDEIDGVDGCVTNPISDTQRYKMCGNAVTVNVIKAIMLKLIQK